MYLYLTQLMKTETGMIFFSVLLGFGFACMFRKVCHGKNCLEYFGASEILEKDKIYQYDSKCYKYIPHLVKCESDSFKNKLKFHS